jgi:hypothetical protein
MSAPPAAWLNALFLAAGRLTSTTLANTAARGRSTNYKLVCLFLPFVRLHKGDAGLADGCEFHTF